MEPLPGVTSSILGLPVGATRPGGGGFLGATPSRVDGAHSVGSGKVTKTRCGIAWMTAQRPASLPARECRVGGSRARTGQLRDASLSSGWPSCRGRATCLPRRGRRKSTRASPRSQATKQRTQTIYIGGRPAAQWLRALPSSLRSSRARRRPSKGETCCLSCPVALTDDLVLNKHTQMRADTLRPPNSLGFPPSCRETGRVLVRVSLRLQLCLADSDTPGARFPRMPPPAMGSSQRARSSWTQPQEGLGGESACDT